MFGHAAAAKHSRSIPQEEPAEAELQAALPEQRVAESAAPPEGSQRTVLLPGQLISRLPVLPPLAQEERQAAELRTTVEPE